MDTDGQSGFVKSSVSIVSHPTINNTGLNQKVRLLVPQFTLERAAAALALAAGKLKARTQNAHGLIQFGIIDNPKKLKMDNPSYQRTKAIFSTPRMSRILLPAIT